MKRFNIRGGEGLLVARHLEVEGCWDCPLLDGEWDTCLVTLDPDPAAEESAARDVCLHADGSPVDDGESPDWCPLAMGCVLVTRKDAGPKGSN